MIARQIKPKIYSVGVIDWNRRLFDELIPLPEGTSYNSYLIKGSEKIALIDTVDPTKEKEFIENLKTLKIEKIDYIISNHAEQDHSGVIPKILELYPTSKVVTNEKCKEFLKNFLLIDDENFLVIYDDATLSLGDKTLRFIFTPWVHWPETMVTYLAEDKILFSCDFFGSHLAISALFADEQEKQLLSAKRYYAEIMMPFRNHIKKNIERISNFQIEIIAPSHGPIYESPEYIINAYKEWVSDEPKNKVTIAYVSMHHSTQEIVSYFADLLIQKGIKVEIFDLPKSDIGELAISLVDSATLVIGTPMILGGAHPHAVFAAHLVNILRPKTKFAAIIGSYGWGGRFIDQLKEMMSNLKLDLVESVAVKGFPKENDFKAIEDLANRIFEKHKEVCM